jgi:hypothetical protein
METTINPRSSTKSIVEKLKKGLIKETEKESVIELLKKRGQDVSEFTKQRGRKRVEGKEGYKGISPGQRVKFAQYRAKTVTPTGKEKPVLLQGTVVNNSNYWLTASGEKKFLLTIKVKDKDTGETKYLSKKAESVELVTA